MFQQIFIVSLTLNNEFVVIILAWGQFFRFLSNETHTNAFKSLTQNYYQIFLTFSSCKQLIVLNSYTQF